MTASGSRRRGSWRNLDAGGALVRSAGYAFVAAALIQGGAMAERALRTSVAQDVALLQAPDAPLPEPAAGPEPADPAVDQADQAQPFDVSGQHPECDLRLLRAIDERSRQLDAWSSDLAARARMLEAIEARASEQVQALQAERKGLETALGRFDQEAEAGIASLVKIYENMKPKEAARIFEAMPAEVAAGFVRRMAEKKSALVMGNISAEHAYAITLALANSRAPVAER